MCDFERLDESLFAILKECRTLPTFLDAVFGFLNRRTDFYVVSNTADAHVGLPEGLAERLVRNTFYKWKPKDLTVESEVPEAVIETEIVDETEVVDEGGTNELEEVEVKNDENKIVSSQEINSDSYNGGVYDNYSWSQTINEIDIIIKTPIGITAKDLSVNILPNKISIKSKRNEQETLIEGELCQSCKHSEAIWSLDTTRSRLNVHLEKRAEMWWDCLLKDEPRLDLTKMDCSRPFEDLPEEAQAKIQELTWNQERKRLGLPTSDELKMHETLRKAWNAEGSPFQGPFDPSVVNFN